MFFLEPLLELLLPAFFQHENQKGDFVYITDNPYSQAQIRTMEMDIMEGRHDERQARRGQQSKTSSDLR